MLNISAGRDFVLATTGRAVSAFGDELAVIALTLRLQAHHGRPFQIALLLAADLVPIVVLGRWAGRLVDAFDSRRLLVGASVAQAACCVALMFAQRPVAVIGWVGVLGVGTAVARPTWQALVPRIVGDEQIGRATSIQQGASAAAMIGAPAAGGILCGIFGTAVPLAIDAATFVLMTVSAALIQTRRHRQPTAEGEDRRRAWSLVRADPVLAVLAGGLAAFVLLTLMVSVVEVFLVRTTLHSSSTWYGCIMAVWVAAIIGGTVVSGRLSRDSHRLLLAAAGALAISVALCGYGLVPAVADMIPLSILGGVGNGAVNSCVAALVMTRTPEDLRGRVAAAVSGLTAAASLVSLTLGGLVASVLAPRTVFLAAGVSGFLTVAAGVAWVSAPQVRVRMEQDRRSGEAVAPRRFVA